ncbi:MAG: bifunctional (p)ppGpp synthetase/guanosine-3',5'-bis(diphosphate) 3'-pyrophosphohydrolase [Pseudomonadota bacterium]
MMRQNELVDRVSAYNPQVDEDLLNRAYVYAMHKHSDQTRASGDPYFSHPLEVAAIVTDLKLDQDSVVAALLHDTIEDTDATAPEIETMFGHDISVLVDGLTKLKRIDLVSKKSRQGENLRRLLLAVADDVRVLLVKLADRLHNMRTLYHVKVEKRQRIAQETMDIYAPLAGRMGMQGMREELEELAFQHLHPEAYALVHEKLSSLYDDSEAVVREIETSVVDSLAKANITAAVKSRNKRPYSVFRKMERSGVSFEQLSDVIGFRVIVDRVEHCYQALGVVHVRWPAVPGRFKDYISTPKQNDYRSIHTTIVGPSQQRVELQIRTHEMDMIAEHGIAAHTLYKDGIYTAPEGLTVLKGDLPGVDRSQAATVESRAYAWLRRTVDALSSEGDHPDDVLEQTRLELYLDQVFCFTPKGRLIALPLGATALDFAYAVHTDIGNSCVGCRVNGQAKPVVHELANGDEVHIITAQDHTPPAAWEHAAITGKARAGIRRATREARTRQFYTLGEKILATTFKRAERAFELEQLEQVLFKLAHKNIKDAVAAVGRGELLPQDVLAAVYPDYQQERTEDSNHGPAEGWFNLTGVTNLMFRVPGRRDEDYSEVTRQLTDSLPILGANSDQVVRLDPDGGAVPGDRIVGIVTPNEGITVYPIHAEGLRKFEDGAAEWLDLRWDLNPDNPERFPAKIDITAVEAPGTLAEISEAIGKADGNIASVFITPPHSGLTDIGISVEVWNLKHLTRIIAAIRRLDVVNRAERGPKK